MTWQMNQRCVAVLLVLMAMAAPVSHAAARPKVVVVPGRNNGAKITLLQISSLIADPLAASADVVSPQGFAVAANAARLRASTLTDPDTAREAARLVSGTHLLMIRGERTTSVVGEKQRKITAPAAYVLLVEIATKTVLLSRIFPFNGRKLTVTVTGEIVSAVAAALSGELDQLADDDSDGDAGPRRMAFNKADSRTAVAPVRVPQPPPTPPNETHTRDGSSAKSSIAWMPELANSPGSTGASAGTLREEIPPKEEPGESTAKGYIGPRVSLAMGGLFYMRNGEVGDSSAAKPRQYKTSTPVASGYLMLQFYPFASQLRGSYAEGFGIESEGMYTQASTQVDGDTSARASSDVVGARGGLLYRIPLVDGVNSFDLKLRAGYAFMAFPLLNTGFIGIGYGGFYAGIGGKIALVERVHLVFGAVYLPRLYLSEDASPIGTLKSSYSFTGEGGVRLVFSPVFLQFTGRVDQYTATFTGASSLKGQIQYTNATLRDRYLSGQTTLGFEM